MHYKQKQGIYDKFIIWHFCPAISVYFKLMATFDLILWLEKKPHWIPWIHPTWMREQKGLFILLTQYTYRKVEIILLQENYRMSIRLEQRFVGCIINGEVMCQVVLQKELKREGNKNELVLSSDSAIVFNKIAKFQALFQAVSAFFFFFLNYVSKSHCAEGNVMIYSVP